MLPIIDLSDPTNPNNYKREVGLAKGLPVNWRDDVTGKLPTAVYAFYDNKADDEHINLIIQYIQHHIHAPCWYEYNPYYEDALYILELRKNSMQLRTSADIKAYLIEAMDNALDPL